jgi:hypothetical protein
MALIFCCGFECGRLSSTVHFASSNGAPTIETTGQQYSGSRSLRCNPNVAVESVRVANGIISGQVLVGRFYVYFVTVPVEGVVALYFDALSSNGVYIQSDSKIYAGAGFSGMGTTGVSIVAGQLYRIDFRVNQSANPHTVDVQVNGTAASQYTQAVAAANLTANNQQFGLAYNSETIGDAYFDDVALSLTAAEYPLGDGYISYASIPLADSAHNITAAAGAFRKGASGADITNATTDSYALIDEIPIDDATPDTDDYIALVAPNNVDYAEYKIGSSGPIRIPGPRAVEIVIGIHQAGTGTGNMRVSLVEPGVVSTVYAATGVAGTINTAYKRIQVAQSGWGIPWHALGDGSFGDFRSLLIRFGPSPTVDVNPEQYLDCVLIEAEVAGLPTDAEYLEGAIAFAAAGAVLATGNMVKPADAALAASGSMSASGQLLRTASSALAVTGAITPTSKLTYGASDSLAVTGVLSPLGGLLQRAETVFAASGAVLADAQVTAAPALAFDAFAGGPDPFVTADTSWTHTPVGVPKGVIVIIVQELATDQIAGVTYGGVAMTRALRQVRTTTEAGTVYIYELYASIPAGPQTVAVDATLATVNDYSGFSFTVAGTGDVERDVTAGADAGIIANPSLAIVPTKQAEIFYGLFSGLAAMVSTAQAGSTHVGARDYGADGAMWARKSVAAAGATTIGYTAGSDDVCHAAIAVRAVTVAGVVHQATATLAASGAVDASSTVQRFGASALSANAVGSFSGGLLVSLAASVGASGAMVSAASKVAPAEASLGASGVVLAAPRHVLGGMAAFGASGTLVPASRMSLRGVTVVSGMTSAVATPSLRLESAVSVAAGAILASTAIIARLASATLSESSQMTSNGVLRAGLAASFGATGTLVAAALALRLASGALAVTSSLAPGGRATYRGTLVLPAAGTFASEAIIARLAAAVVSVSASAQGVGTVRRTAESGLGGTGSLLATGQVTGLSVSAALAGAASVGLTARATYRASSNLPASGAVVAVVTGLSLAASSLAASGALGSAALVVRTGASSLGASSVLSASGQRSALAAIALAAQASAVGAAGLSLQVSSTLTVAAQVVSVGIVIEPRVPLALSAVWSPVLVMTARFTPIVGLVAQVEAPIAELTAVYAPVVHLVAELTATIFLGASTMSIDAPITEEMQWFVGEDKTLRFTVVDDTPGHLPVNINGWEFEWMLREYADAPRPYVVKQMGPTGIVIQSAAQGIVDVLIQDENTEELPGGVFYHTLRRIDDGSSSVLAHGEAVLQRGATR